MKVDVVGGPMCGKVYDVDPRQTVILFPKPLPVNWWAEEYQNDTVEIIQAPIRKRLDGTYGIDCIHISRHP